MTQAEITRQADIKIKNTIDSWYNNTKEPLKASMKSMGSPMKEVGTLLKKRGILINKGTPMEPIMCWNSDMAPTDNLYKEIRKDYKEYFNKGNKDKKAKMKKTEVNTPEVKEEPKIRKATIKDYSSQELWEELKSRGYAVSNNRLCKTTYLD